MLEIICIKWGSTWYKEEDVNKLYYSIKKNTTLPFNFHCFTEISANLDKNIIVHPLPVFSIKISGWSYQKEAALCNDELGGLRGKRVFFFDIDTTITNNLDELFLYPKDDEFYIIKDWYRKNVGQASFYTWVVGKLGWVLEDYERNHLKYFKKFGSAAQEFLSSKIIEKYGKINFLPSKWFVSFKHDCLPPWYLRKFKPPFFYNKETCKILVFHGTPKFKEAMEGVWLEKNGKKPNFIKRFFYKTILPSKWLEDYL